MMILLLIINYRQHKTEVQNKCCLFIKEFNKMLQKYKHALLTYLHFMYLQNFSIFSQISYYVAKNFQRLNTLPVYLKTTSMIKHISQFHQLQEIKVNTIIVVVELTVLFINEEIKILDLYSYNTEKHSKGHTVSFHIMIKFTDYHITIVTSIQKFKKIY